MEGGSLGKTHRAVALRNDLVQVTARVCMGDRWGAWSPVGVRRPRGSAKASAGSLAPPLSIWPVPSLASQ